MLKKTITYTDFNDEEQTEDFYFHLSRADLAELSFEHPGGLKGYLEEIIKAEDAKQIVETFKTIIARSVGIRSEDGRHFKKSAEISNDFMQTAAYDEMFMELITDEKDAVLVFVKGILPATLVDAAEKAELEPKEYTVAELEAMSREEFAAVAGNDPRNMTRDQLMVSFTRKAQEEVVPVVKKYADSL